MSAEADLKKLRDSGWAVAVHNDYRQDQMKHTFWLLTFDELHVFVKGEGLTDEEALDSAEMVAPAIHKSAIEGRRARAGVRQLMADIEQGQKTFTAEDITHALRCHGWGREIKPGDVA